MEASKRVAENEEKAKIAKEQKGKEKEDNAVWTAISALGKWLNNGPPVNTNGHPKLNKTDAKAIVKVLLGRIAPEEKFSSYDSMKKCNKWLAEVAGGTTWVVEMKQVETENWECPIPAQRLF